MRGENRNKWRRLDFFLLHRTQSHDHNNRYDRNNMARGDERSPGKECLVCVIITRISKMRFTSDLIMHPVVWLCLSVVIKTHKCGTIISHRMGTVSWFTGIILRHTTVPCLSFTLSPPVLEVEFCTHLPPGEAESICRSERHPFFHSLIKIWLCNRCHKLEERRQGSLTHTREDAG